MAGVIDLIRQPRVFLGLGLVFLILTLAIPRAMIFLGLSASGAAFEFAGFALPDLAALILAVGLFNKARQTLVKMPAPNHASVLLLLGFLGLGALSLVGARWPTLGLVFWLKTAIATGLWFGLGPTQKATRPIFVKGFLGLTVIQALLGIWQFALQRSLGLSWLGEAIIGPEIAGVAKISLGGERIIRAYGTFGHPNILAVILGVGLILLLAWFFEASKKGARPNFLFWFSLPVMLAGLGLTFSRGAIAMTLLGATWLLVRSWRLERKPWRRQQIGIIAAIVLLICGIFSFAFTSLTSARLGSLVAPDEGQTLRGIYDQVAISMIKDRPLWGVGLGNFVPYFRDHWPAVLPSWAYQPSHNTPLLVAAETGILGALMLTAFLVLILTRAILVERHKPNTLHRALVLGLVVVLGASVTDHYIWTDSAGRYLFWLLLGLI